MANAPSRLKSAELNDPLGGAAGFSRLRKRSRVPIGGPGAAARHRHASLAVGLAMASMLSCSDSNNKNVDSSRCISICARCSDKGSCEQGCKIQASDIPSACIDEGNAFFDCVASSANLTCDMDNNASAKECTDKFNSLSACQSTHTGDGLAKNQWMCLAEGAYEVCNDDRTSCHKSRGSASAISSDKNDAGTQAIINCKDHILKMVMWSDNASFTDDCVVTNCWSEKH